MATVNIATTCPHGVILQLSQNPSAYAAKPAYQSVKVGSALSGATNAIDANFWTNWTAENSQNPLYVNNVVFQT